MDPVFWLAVGLVVYANLLYPLLMAAIGRRHIPRHMSDPHDWPTVAVIVAAHNEERHIETRIRNLLDADYDARRLHIYIGSDGSTDRTAQLAAPFESERVHVYPFAERRGKASVLNDLVAASSEEILVFTDANTLFDRSALKALVRHFADPAIGAVSGELTLDVSFGGDNRDSTYWNLETMLKKGESTIGGLLGANGAIYAIRNALYRPIPTDTIVDDFTIVMNVSAQRYGVVFEPRALAHEDSPDGMEVEFRRRIRIGAGNYQAFFRYPEYWYRTSWVRRFTYVSHKVLRWFTPHLLVVALLRSFQLMDQPLYHFLFFVQIIGYSLLGSALMLRHRVALPRVVTLPLFIFTLNLAFLIGFLRYLRGNLSGHWYRTERA